MKPDYKKLKKVQQDYIQLFCLDNHARTKTYGPEKASLAVGISPSGGLEVRVIVAEKNSGLLEAKTGTEFARKYELPENYENETVNYRLMPKGVKARK